MEHDDAIEQEAEAAKAAADERRAREREALRRRVRESLVRCPDVHSVPRA